MSAPDTNGWMPIESAPEYDGTEVLVIGGRYRSATVMHADGDHWRNSGLKAVPTHWQPLPGAPVA